MFFKKMVTLFSLLIVAIFLTGCPNSRNSDQPYSWDDLYQEAKSHSPNIQFDNGQVPSGSRAWLPPQSPDIFWITTSYFHPGRRGMRILSNHDTLTFPWSSLQGSLQKGDIVSLRTGGAGAYVVRLVSSFTHDAMIFDKDPDRPVVFESMKSRGVNQYNPNESWSNIVTIAVNRVKSLDAGSISMAVDRAWGNYTGLPYFPSLMRNSMPRRDFFIKWSDKYDKESMYCSKLVWWTFKDAGVDLDSNRTRSLSQGNFQSERTDYAGEAWNAWIGVSPDDIYYSNHLSGDIYTAGAHNLASPMPWWFF